MISKKTLSERDICTKFITPALEKADWDIHAQVREKVFLTNGRILVGAVGIIRTRHAIKAALLADFAGIGASLILARLFYF